jgi:DNA repair protein RadC
MPSIADLPPDERPRQRMALHGAAALSDAEVVALLIEPGTRGRSSIDIARELVAGGLLSLARAEWVPGKRVGSLGPSRVARIGAALELGRRVAALSAPDTAPIHEPTSLAARLIATYGHHAQETFGGFFLDAQHRIISERVIARGTVNSAPAHPRDVFRLALQDNAVSVILFHNHPSGTTSPSHEDLAATRAIIDSGKLMGVEIRDHLIIGRHSVLSMKRAGFMADNVGRRPSWL